MTLHVQSSHVSVHDPRGKTNAFFFIFANENAISFFLTSDAF